MLSFLLLFPASCKHVPETVLPEPGSDFKTKTFDVDEKIIFKALTRTFKERSLGEAKLDPEKNQLETEYLVQGDWRTKAVASIKKISRREREVTLKIITEENSSSGWEPRKVLGKDQYDQFFSELELQIYRELSHPE